MRGRVGQEGRLSVLREGAGVGGGDPLGRAPLAGILVTAAILPTLMASLATQ